MLSFMFNEKNIYRPEMLSPEAKKELSVGIGISHTLPENVRNELGSVAKVIVFDTGLALGENADESRVSKAVSDTVSLGAVYAIVGVGNTCDVGSDQTRYENELASLKESFAEKGITILVTNRRAFSPEKTVSASKLSKLCAKTGVRIAHDLGASHADLHALENYFDLRDQTEMLLLNDNYGKNARFPVGHWQYDPTHQPDEMAQPGYGTLPFVRIMEDVRENIPDVMTFINGQRFGNAPLTRVLLETRTLIAGKVYISPAGGVFGKDSCGRLLI